MSSTEPVSVWDPVFKGDGQVAFLEKPVPSPGAGELLLQVNANALCGSERGQFYRGASVTPGHEAVGTVVAVGTGTHTPLGTMGAVYLMDFCGACRSCRLGFTNQCLHKRGDMGFNRDGGYGRYELIHENIFFPVEKGFSAAEATLLLDVMGTGGHAVDRCRLFRADLESLLILGAGPIGLGVLAMAKIILGPEVTVFVSDVIPYRLRLAERLGGLPIDATTGLTKNLARQGLDCVDAAVDTSGKQAARQEAVKALAQRGVLVCVGHGEAITLDVTTDLIAAERSVIGSEYFGYSEFAANLPRLRVHRSYLKQIITHRFSIDQVQQAFELFFGGETGKVVIEQ
ncbi:MAG TPA: alcohol dehydrogenase catalytic domain-containing protein [Chthoniobacterales bacterium]